MRRSGAKAKPGPPRMAAGQGGGYRGRAGWVQARHIVKGGPAGVSGKRWVKQRGIGVGLTVG